MKIKCNRNVSLDILLTDTILSKEEKQTVTQLSRQQLSQKFDLFIYLLNQLLTIQNSFFFKFIYFFLKKRFILSMDKVHVISTREGQEVVKKGVVKEVLISVERRGNKIATIISDLDVFFISPDDFAKEMQRKLACSVTGFPFLFSFSFFFFFFSLFSFFFFLSFLFL